MIGDPSGLTAIGAFSVNGCSTGRRSHVPATEQNAVALPHQKAITCVRRFCWVIAAARHIVELRERYDRAPIGQLVPYLVVAFGTIDWAEDHDVGFILDLAACVARREADIGNDGIVWIGGIYLAANSADEFFVRTGGAE